MDRETHFKYLKQWVRSFCSTRRSFWPSLGLCL